jgi:hypothetical protein
MHLVQVEPTGAEPVRAGHRALLDDRGDRQQREDLRGQEDRVPVVAERRAEDTLAAPQPVDLGGVEHGDAELHRPAHDGVRLLPGVALAVAPFPGAELPGAQPDPGKPGAGPWIQIAHAPVSASAAGHYHLSMAIWS